MVLIKNIKKSQIFLLRNTMLLFAYFLILSCSNTKQLVDNQSLLVKNKITYSGVKADPRSNEIFQNSIRPRPNRKILGTRTRLRVYNAMGEPKTNNFWMFVKKNMGEAPVLYDEKFNTKVKNAIAQKARENGFFHVDIVVSPKTMRKKTTVTYDLKLKEAYKIGDFIFEKDGSRLAEDIDSLFDNTFVKKEDQYRVRTLRDERDRIEYALKNKGYFNFSADYLIFDADSIDNYINLKLSLKKGISPKAYVIYTINNIEVNYGYEVKEGKYKPIGATTYDSVLVRYTKDDYIPSVFTNQLFLKPGDQYQIQYQQKSLSYYSNLNVFKFVNLIFKEDSVNNSSLNVNLYLSSLPKRKFETELGFATKSSGYIGPSINFSILNRNLFKRAINLTTQIHAGLEWQYGNEKELKNVVNLGISERMRFPKLFWPFNYDGTGGLILPHTAVEANYNYFNYNPMLKSHIINLNMGYFFMNKKNTSIEIRPFNSDYYINFVTDRGFVDDIKDYPSLMVSLEDRFIIGGNYYLIWNSKLIERHKNLNRSYYFKTGIDLSGNTVYAIQNLVGTYDGLDNTLFGMAYSQFVRLENDFRFYKEVKTNMEFAYRFIANLGLPYLNSTQIPYYKQYFIGGANSIQAFMPRRIGPGGYYEAELSSGSFIKHSGEIWLEMDMEYRFNISGRIDGAIFASAGNVWLKEKDEYRPLAEFDFNRFQKEIAIGTGLGLRLNYDILVIRLDWGVPLRYPYDNLGGNWIFEHNDFNYFYPFNQSILNFAIGYPF